MDEPDTGTTPYTPRSFWHTALLCCGLAGAILFSVVYFCFGLISPDYFILSQSIGDLQLQPHGWIQSANFVMAGMFLLAFAAGLRQELVNDFGAVLIPLFHVLTGFGLIIFGLTLRGAMHIYAGLGGFLCVLISLLLMAGRFASDVRWRGWVNYTIITTVLMMILSTIFCYSLINKVPYSGIWERLTVLVRIIWMGFFTLRLLNGRRLSPVS